MAVMKYKSFEEAGNHLTRLLPGDAIARLLRLQELLKHFRPPKRIQRGIFKFKTISEANEHRENT